MAAAERAGERGDGGDDEAAIRRVVADFADAFNRHDAAAVVRDFAEDVDHVSVRGRWQRGRAELEQTQRRFHATIWAGMTYHPAVEHLRFLRPDVAAVLVRGTLRAASGAEEAARSTWIMSREGGRWLCRAFHQSYVADIPLAPGAPSSPPDGGD